MNSQSMSPRAAIIAALVFALAVVGAFHETAWGMVSIWWRSGTFTHAFLVLPISVWLIWERRQALLSAGFAPAGLPLLFLAGAALLWIFGEAISAAVISHFALAFMIIAAVWAVWGHRATRAVIFPLGFLLFAVPFGDFLVPTLMHYTAEFTVGLLRLSGVPVYQEGQSFVIPSGRWSVVEACSGIRYLIASLMVGVLFAYLNYRSLKRRLFFVLASLLVPLVANWGRAYLIVMIGHYSGNTLAVGADHLVYGWVFFGIVIGLLFWVGSLWREDLDTASKPAMVRPVSTVSLTSGRSGAIVLALAAACIVAPRPLLNWLLDLGPVGTYSIPFVQGAQGWQGKPESAPMWSALFKGQRADVAETFVRGNTAITLQMAYFAKQSEGHELVQYDNRLVDTEDPLWGVIAQKGIELDTVSGGLRFQRAELKGAGGHIVALRTYWLGESVTPSDKAAKLDLLRSRLLRQPDDSAGIVIWSPVKNSVAEADSALADFVKDNWTAIDAALKRTAIR